MLIFRHKSIFPIFLCICQATLFIQLTIRERAFLSSRLKAFEAFSDQNKSGKQTKKIEAYAPRKDSRIKLSISTAYKKEQKFS